MRQRHDQITSITKNTIPKSRGPIPDYSDKHRYYFPVGNGGIQMIYGDSKAEIDEKYLRYLSESAAAQIERSKPQKPISVMPGSSDKPCIGLGGK